MSASVDVTHYPLPWTVEYVDSWRRRAVLDARRQTVGFANDKNSDFIVKAVNCHEELLAALHRACNYIESGPDDPSDYDHVIPSARAALAKAEGR